LSAELFLSSVVEVAIGMAGFAGIVAAIRQRDIARWPREQRLLLQMLFAASAAAIAFALLPTLLDEAELPRSTLWRVVSGSLAVWFASIGAFRFNQARRSAVAFPFRGLFVAWTGFLIRKRLRLLPSPTARGPRRARRVYLTKRCIWPVYILP
jgi:hypothetical protein